MILLNIDPGSKQKKSTLEKRGTGWAVIDLPIAKPPTLLTTGLLPGGTSSLLAAILDVEHELGAWWHHAEHVVVENFILLEARASIEPLEMVGAVRGVCAAQGKAVTVQNPADRTIVSHDDLKRVGMWPGSAGHADEAQAVRHGLAWALKNGHRPTVELLAPDDGTSDEDAPSGPSGW